MVFAIRTGRGGLWLDGHGCGRLTLAACERAPASTASAMRGRIRAVAAAHALPIHGVDVSRWQRQIDWASVASSGKRFAFIKATEGGDHVDPLFLQNWVGAARAGMPRSRLSLHVLVPRRRPAGAPGSGRSCRTIRTRCRPCSTSSGTANPGACPRKVAASTGARDDRAHAAARWKRIPASARSSTRTSPSTRRSWKASSRTTPHWIRSTAAEPE